MNQANVPRMANPTLKSRMVEGFVESENGHTT